MSDAKFFQGEDYSDESESEDEEVEMVQIEKI